MKKNNSKLPHILGSNHIVSEIERKNETPDIITSDCLYLYFSESKSRRKNKKKTS